MSFTQESAGIHANINGEQQEVHVETTTLTSSIKMLSLNVFGVFIAQDIIPRMVLLGQQIAKEKYDVCALQEQFSETHLKIILDACHQAGGWAPNQWHTHRAVYCAEQEDSIPGLTVISKFPIVSAAFVPYSLGGRRERLWELDAYANRGIQIVKLDVPCNMMVSVDGEVGGDGQSEVTNSSFGQQPPSTALATANFGKLATSNRFVRTRRYLRKALGPRWNAGDEASGFGGSFGFGGDDYPSMSTPLACATAPLVIFNTHLNAQFHDYSKVGGYKQEKNAPYRLVQSFELAELISATFGGGAPLAEVARDTDGNTSPARGLHGMYENHRTANNSSPAHPPTHPFVVCGDMNAGPNSPEMQLLHAITDRAGLPLDNTVDAGNMFTLSEENKYNHRSSYSYLRMMGMQEQLPQRVDHIFLPREPLASTVASVMRGSALAAGAMGGDRSSRTKEKRKTHDHGDESDDEEKDRSYLGTAWPFVRLASQPRGSAKPSGRIVFQKPLPAVDNGKEVELFVSDHFGVESTIEIATCVAYALPKKDGDNDSMVQYPLSSSETESTAEGRARSRRQKAERRRHFSDCGPLFSSNFLKQCCKEHRFTSRALYAACWVLSAILLCQLFTPTYDNNTLLGMLALMLPIPLIIVAALIRQGRLVDAQRFISVSEVLRQRFA